VASPRDTHRLTRSLEELTIEAHRSLKKNERREAQLGGGTFMQYLTVLVTGRVDSSLQSIDVPVDWELPFLMRVDPRNADGRTNPHFTSGVELVTDSFVNITCQVRGWVENESGWVTGAKMRFLAFAPGAARGQVFIALAHLTFTGYAAPYEDTL
jgi:hypothetical protein